VSQITWEAQMGTHLEADLAEVPQCPHKRRHGGGVVERKFGAATHSKTLFLGIVHVTPKRFSLGECNNIKTSRCNDIFCAVHSQNDNTNLLEGTRVSNCNSTLHTSPSTPSPMRTEIFVSQRPFNGFINTPIPNLDAGHYNNRPGQDCA
jgi:hypothetical protein